MTPGNPDFAEALRDLACFLEACGEYLDRVVLGGGWVPWFYRHLPEVAEPASHPLLTFDFDLVVPRDLPLDRGGTLHDHLLRGGFVPVRNREPPIVFYQHERWGDARRAPVYGELLTPLEGMDTRALRCIQDGVHAQQLRYLDLLLHEPLELPVARVRALGPIRGLILRLPNPSAYVLQKALALGKRRSGSHPKDFAYTFDVALLWSRRVERVREMTRSIVKGSRVWSRWAEKGVRVLREAFADQDSEGPVSVETVYRGTAEGPPVTANAAVRIVRPFLEAGFARGLEAPA